MLFGCYRRRRWLCSTCGFNLQGMLSIVPSPRAHLSTPPKPLVLGRGTDHTWRLAAISGRLAGIERSTLPTFTTCPYRRDRNS